MIDTSDGFLGTWHICEESRVGRIIQRQLPLMMISEAALMLHQDPYDLFLGESDDYELVITCRRRMWRASVRDYPCGPVLLTEVGRITDEAARYPAPP